MILPAAAPKIFAGLRISLSIAVILMVISELIAATNGVGFRILQAQRQFKMVDLWAGARGPRRDGRRAQRSAGADRTARVEMEPDMTTDLSTPTTTAHESLAAAGLGHVYGVGTPEEHRALDGITFSIDRGEFVAIVGPSGCGKTTLLRCLSGLMTPTSGSVTLDGVPVESVPEDLTLVFQDYRRSLYPWLRVDANVEFPLRYSGIDKRERAERVRQALDDVGLPATAASTRDNSRVGCSSACRSPAPSPIGRTCC